MCTGTKLLSESDPHFEVTEFFRATGAGSVVVFFCYPGRTGRRKRCFFEHFAFRSQVRLLPFLTVLCSFSETVHFFPPRVDQQYGRSSNCHGEHLRLQILFKLAGTKSYFETVNNFLFSWPAGLLTDAYLRVYDTTYYLF